MQPRKLFQRPFDITQFRRASPSPAPVHHATVPSAPTASSPPPPADEENDETLKCFDKSPPDLAAGVQKPVPSPPRPLQFTNPLPSTQTEREGGGDEEDGAGKKRKKHKKEKKQRKHDGTYDFDDDPLMILCSAAMSSTLPPVPPVPAPVVAEPAIVGPTTTTKRPYDQAFNPDFETYMAGQAETVNEAVKQRHATDVAAVSASIGGKSMGDRKYGCLFCGGIHQLESVEKGNDPPCLRTGAFAKFIQDFLFRYDIAPDQEWRRMFMFKTPGFRRAMADRFATIVSHEPADAEWTSFMHRRAWETRTASYKSNAGIARDLFQQQRVQEFIYFNSSGSSSPRPGSALMFGPGPIAASPVNLEPPPLPAFNPFWISGPLPPTASSSSTYHA